MVSERLPSYPTRCLSEQNAASESALATWIQTPVESGFSNTGVTTPCKQHISIIRTEKYGPDLRRKFIYLFLKVHHSSLLHQLIFVFVRNVEKNRFD
jgi:hypothetical protein